MRPDDRGSLARAAAETSESIDAAWAHNRWPTIGLHAGAGCGLLMGIAFVSGWMWTLAFMLMLAVAGCLVGFGLAGLMFRRSRGASSPLLRGQLQPAAEDHGGDAADENAPGSEDGPGGVPRSEEESHDHGQQA
jgi:hypothetical protein